MEGSVSGLTKSSRAMVNSYVNEGGTLILTGTYGTKDVNWLNSVFSWDVTSVGCSSIGLNEENAAGTVFETSAPTVDCPSATDHINCGSTPCIPIYGTATKTAVAIFAHGAGSVIYIGFDYYNTGFAVDVGAGVHRNCARRTDAFVSTVLPLALTAAQARSPQAPPVPPTPPPPPESPSPPPSLEKKVLVYAQPRLLGGGAGDCSDESANLQSIVQHLINTSPVTIGGDSYDYSDYRVDASVTRFSDPLLGEKLSTAAVFLMTEMEGSLSGWGPTA